MRGVSDRGGSQTVEIPVRAGRFGYVRVSPDGSAHDLRVGADDRERGTSVVAVTNGDRILEIALGSTSDRDLDPGRGQLWPEEGDE